MTRARLPRDGRRRATSASGGREGWCAFKGPEGSSVQDALDTRAWSGGIHEGLERGAFTDTTVITHTPASGTPPGGELNDIGNVFDLTAVYSDMEKAAEVERRYTYTVTSGYSDTLLGHGGGYPGAPLVGRGCRYVDSTGHQQQRQRHRRPGHGAGGAPLALRRAGGDESDLLAAGSARQVRQVGAGTSHSPSRNGPRYHRYGKGKTR